MPIQVHRQNRQRTPEQVPDMSPQKKLKPYNPDDPDDDEPPNEPGQSSSAPPLPVVHTPDNTDEEHDEDDDAATIFYPEAQDDLYVLEDKSHWCMLPESHKVSAMTCSFSFPRDVESKVFDVSQIHTTQRTFLALGLDVGPELSTACAVVGSALAAPSRAKVNRARKEASVMDKRHFAKQFLEAKKAEYQSWLDNDVFELVDMRKLKVRNFVSGRWVLTIKRDKDGSFQKCKARWVLRGFQDRQKDEQQTDSPAATRPGFRLLCQLAANRNLQLYHIDLKTAFLQGEAYDETRDIICQLPPESGHPSYIGARMKKPAYGLNDAPRRWWNIVDKHLLSYGMVPTRADRCCYVLHSNILPKTQPADRPKSTQMDTLEKAMEYLLDPVSGSPTAGKTVCGALCLHVDDLFMAGNSEFYTRVIEAIRKDFKVGSEDHNDIMFVGQRIRWIENRVSGQSSWHIQVDQERCIEELEEIKFDKSLKDQIQCDKSMHTEFRSVLGQINWLQSRTQYQVAYSFSRCASAAAAPTIADVRALNKVVRKLKSELVQLHFWPLTGPCRILGYPDASYRNNPDKSSQRGQVVFIAEQRNKSKDSRGSLVDFESKKINRTTLSTTVAELYGLMKCFGTCQFLKGLWMDMTGQEAEIHIRTDANNLVATASTTHLPEQKETIHMIQMLRQESLSGAIADLAHVRTAYCLADALTKQNAKPDVLVKAVSTGVLPEVDTHPPFRSLVKHKAFLIQWAASNLDHARDIHALFGEHIQLEMAAYFACCR